MTTATLYRSTRPGPGISFELYPPRTPKGEATLTRTVGALAEIDPDYFSITYGASGSTRTTSRDLIGRILTDTPITPLAHLTCVGACEDDLAEYVSSLLQAGVRDFLALRGDPPAGQPDWRPHPEGLTRASQLVQLLRRLAAEHLGTDGADVSISVATYPGGSYDDAGRPVVAQDDVSALLEKQAAGADFAITQLFYDARHYAELVRAARAAGVHIPIVAGLIPLTDPGRLRRMVELTGVAVPPELLTHLDTAPDKEEAYRRGLAASVQLVHDVLEHGAPGIHFYTFNSSRAVLDLLHASGLR
ncbi:methylenetetrahydrofolate reductase [Ruania halotolerans]|uniref:methylenetetrahydrofolate reductase n=1 Tax=Ruania halotolerans TaxID=2897773 RepID=UPI001E402831|nr:methylenetetrahydrofolate reductase [Ruania halotolerans]UFU06847.1 methylenetetrahydrofolate reductase [Ruania halotolerans]